MPRMDPGIPALQDCSPAHPLYIAHRGAAALAPENTMEAYRAAYASGLRVLEQDVCLLRDGALGVLHDATVDRLTHRTGPTQAFDSAEWQTLRIDTRRWGGAFGTYVTPPLFADVLDEFKDRVLFVPEAKTPGSGAPLVAALQAAGIATQHAIVQAFHLQDLEAAIAAGYPAMFLTRKAADIAAARSLGVTWAGIAKDASDGVFRAWVEAGFNVVAWTVDRVDTRDHLLALGVCGFFSDDPLALMAGR